MKKQSSSKIKLGIFVSLGLVLLIGGIYFIGKKQSLFNSTIRVSAIFKDINGLQVGNNVRFAGITVGVIDNLEMLADTAVRVDLVIDESARKFIKKDSKATIGSDGLMGNKIVIIMPGTATQKAIENTNYLVTYSAVSIDEIMVKLNTTASNAAGITDNLLLITDNISQGRGTIGKLFMDTSFAKNIDQAVINIRQGTGGFKQNMDAAGHNVLLRGYFKNKKAKAESKEEPKK